MNTNELMAISPIDGRYKKHTELLTTYFSEFALMKYRIHVEIEYFISLCEIPIPQLEDFSKDKIEALREVVNNFSLEDGAEIKEIESVTNHDVKAIEYFIKKKFDLLKLNQYKEFIHFGLTSQDINNTAFPLMWKDALQKIYIPQLESLCTVLSKLSVEWKDVPMLARTH
ncbi:MAG: lyase family protein, partial [Dysgonamonadaceae bacterium]